MLFTSRLSVGGLLFFFKQKTAYEMRISDWSSDVCSSDLARARSRFGNEPDLLEAGILHRIDHAADALVRRVHVAADMHFGEVQIGRASCRERVCQYV